MLKIWGRPNSINVQKVMWTVGELGLEHERLDVGGAFGKLDTDDYGRLNPNRKIPVVEDGEIVVWESQACVRFIAARYDAGGLYASDSAERSLADRWMDWKVTTVLPHLHVCFWGLVRTAEADRDMAVIERAAKDLGEVWKLLDDHLDGKLYVVGDRLTMGDIPLGTAFYRYVSLPIERPSLPHVERWYDRLKARPAFVDQVMIPVT
ncbi:MAG: glutathione S-transferase family protein [Geminicoccaceae bacterium]